MVMRIGVPQVKILPYQVPASGWPDPGLGDTGEQKGYPRELGDESNPIFQLPLPARNAKFWNTTVGVAAATSPLVAPDSRRLALLIANLSAATIYLDQKIVLLTTSMAGFPLGPGNSLSIDSYFGPIFAIATAPGALVGIVELLR